MSIRESREGKEIGAAVDETDQLIGTFNALLLIAEAEAGVAREKMAPVDLPAVVEGVAELYGPVAEEKGIALEIAPCGQVTIAGNKRLISQALANLLDNAIKYTPSGGSVNSGGGGYAFRRCTVRRRYGPRHSRGGACACARTLRAAGRKPQFSRHGIGIEPRCGRRAPARCALRSRRQQAGTESDICCFPIA